MNAEISEAKVWLKHYDEGVHSSLSYPEVGLPSILDQASDRYTTHAATIFMGRRISYRKMGELANKFANSLLNLGVKPGDRVAIHLPNCPQFVIAYYGILKVGGIVVPINPLYKGKDLSYVISDSGAKTIVTLTKLYPNLEEIAETAGIETVIVTNIKDFFPLRLKALFTLFKEKKEGHRLKAADAKKTLLFSDLLKRAGNASPGIETSPDEPAIIQYTGGTTGVPKGAILTHRNLVSNAIQVKHWLRDVKPGKEVFVSVLPFFHIYGMTTSLNLPILVGASMLLFPQFEVKQLMEGITRNKATIFCGVPSIYIVIINSKKVREYDLSSIKFCVSGAAPLPVEVQSKFEKITGSKLVEGYGLTEASPVTHANPLYGMRKEGIGIPLPDTDAKIVDLETGEDLPSGGIGELVVKGPQVMRGYWNSPIETKATIRAEWLHTGDIAQMDEDGFFKIVDRAKDMIIMGGFNVYPREVEEVLFAHPKVKEAAVVGKSHILRGQIIKAFVVLKSGEEAKKSDIISFCREQLPKYKTPREIEFVSEIPKTLVGKPLRRILREKESP